MISFTIIKSPLPILSFFELPVSGVSTVPLLLFTLNPSLFVKEEVPVLKKMLRKRKIKFMLCAVNCERKENSCHKDRHSAPGETRTVFPVSIHAD